MRNVNLTTVNVQVNDRSVRTNVVVKTIRTELLRLRLCLRHACKPFAKHYGEWQRGSQAMVPVAVSPSLGGLRSSGGPGIALGS